MVPAAASHGPSGKDTVLIFNAWLAFRTSWTALTALFTSGAISFHWLAIQPTRKGRLPSSAVAAR